MKSQNGKTAKIAFNFMDILCWLWVLIKRLNTFRRLKSVLCLFLLLLERGHITHSVHMHTHKHTSISLCLYDKSWHICTCYKHFIWLFIVHV